MPSRYLRASYIDSRRINRLTAEGERLFCRLLVHVDDFGRCEADVRMLRGKLFSLQDISLEDMSRWRDELCANDLLQLYVVDGIEYIEMSKWERGRAQSSKFPSPERANSRKNAPHDAGGEQSPDPNPNTDKELQGHIEGFSSFWGLYPKKRGRVACRRAWDKIKPLPPLQDILSALDAQKQSEQWMSDNGKFIPNPLTWIHQRRWEDVLEQQGNARSIEDE